MSEGSWEEALDGVGKRWFGASSWGEGREVLHRFLRTLLCAAIRRELSAMKEVFGAP